MRNCYRFSSSSLCRCAMWGVGGDVTLSNHSWVKGIKICLNDTPRLFPMTDNRDITKIYWQLLEIFSRNCGNISTKLGTKHIRDKSVPQYSMEKGMAHSLTNSNTFTKGYVFQMICNFLEDFSFKRNIHFNISKFILS